MKKGRKMIRIVDLGTLAKRPAETLDSWNEAYDLRDMLQTQALFSGYNLHEHRFALRPEYD